ncbi:hypothetical protein UlMin_035650 [Ulmus minor]
MWTNKLSLPLLLHALFFVSVSLCISPDAAVLLAFKASSDPSNSLSSWADSSDPCSNRWLGVTCNPDTHRVTRLVLENLNLTGSAHSLSQLVQLRYISLNHNHLSSSLDFSPWISIKHIYLSHNHFSGQLPSGISRLRRLRRLDVSYNYFSGKIPMTDLSQLPHLLTLRLESNSFEGELGRSILTSYSYPLSDFKVSSNNLSGKIPAWLWTFPATSFAGNNLLCGKPLPSDCPNPTAHNSSSQPNNPNQNRKKPTKSLILTIIGVIAAVVLVPLAVTVTCFWYGKRGRGGGRGSHPNGPRGGAREDGGAMVVFEGCKGIGEVEDLLKASAEMLGKGSVGSTYKVVMDGGDAVVVKRVRDRRFGNEVEWWLRGVGVIRHPNVVSLRAYNLSHDELLLVYDYFPIGSLYNLLHGNRGPGRTPLEWSTRLKLASGAAKGLFFVHDQTKAKLFHGNLTSSNILVDHSGNACISEIGLHQLLRASFSSPTPYTAPELTTTNTTKPRKLTNKCDVYSFGVVLLEILTGKPAAMEGETSLVKWVQSVAREEWTWEVLDIELLRDREMEEEIMTLLQVALLCLAPSPKDRPTMSMIHTMIEDIRSKGAVRMKSILDHLSSSDGSSPSHSETSSKFL